MGWPVRMSGQTQQLAVPSSGTRGRDEPAMPGCRGGLVALGACGLGLFSPGAVTATRPWGGWAQVSPKPLLPAPRPPPVLRLHIPRGPGAPPLPPGLGLPSGCCLSARGSSGLPAAWSERLHRLLFCHLLATHSCQTSRFPREGHRVLSLQCVRRLLKIYSSALAT